MGTLRWRVKDDSGQIDQLDIGNYFFSFFVSSVGISPPSEGAFSFSIFD